jgi:DNA-binding transcriptional ArsR family regulator
VIQRDFGITQAAVSQHLKVLRDSGFASVCVGGTRRIYAIDAQPFQEIDAGLNHFRQFWEVDAPCPLRPRSSEGPGRQRMEPVGRDGVYLQSRRRSFARPRRPRVAGLSPSNLCPAIEWGFFIATIIAMAQFASQGHRIDAGGRHD